MAHCLRIKQQLFGLKFHNSKILMVLNHTKHDYALATLSVPVSNAVVEKVFNHVTWLKKYMNKRSLNMLDSMIRVRFSLKLQDICCHRMMISSKIMENSTKTCTYDAFEVTENDIIAFDCGE